MTLIEIRGATLGAFLVDRIMYLLTEWEGRTGKYLARGHGVRTERSPCAMTEGQIFSRPARPNSVNKHFIIFSFFRVTKSGMFTYVAHFDRKVVLVRISRALSLQNY